MILVFNLVRLFVYICLFGQRKTKQGSNCFDLGLGLFVGHCRLNCGSNSLHFFEDSLRFSVKKMQN